MDNTQKINATEIEINGVKYIPKDSVQSNPNHQGEIKIVVLQRGWIYIGRFSRKENTCQLRNAYCIRTWGTTKGLPELVNGETTSTKLDKCERVVEFDWLTIVHTITVNQDKWKTVIA